MEKSPGSPGLNTNQVEVASPRHGEDRPIDLDELDVGGVLRDFGALLLPSFKSYLSEESKFYRNLALAISLALFLVAFDVIAIDSLKAVELPVIKVNVTIQKAAAVAASIPLLYFVLFFFLQASADKSAFNLSQAPNIWQLDKYLRQLERELDAEREILNTRRQELYKLELRPVLRRHHQNFADMKLSAERDHRATESSVAIMNATLDQLSEFVRAHNLFWGFHKWGHVGFTLAFAASAVIAICFQFYAFSGKPSGALQPGSSASAPSLSASSAGTKR